MILCVLLEQAMAFQNDFYSAQMKESIFAELSFMEHTTVSSCPRCEK
jgi:hypothetical protein